MVKARTAPPLFEDAGVNRSLSSQSLQGGTSSYTPLSAAASSVLGPPTAISSQSVEEAFPPGFSQNGSFSESKDDSKKSNRVQSPNYRDELKAHGVCIDSYGMSIPEAVQTFAQNLCQKERSSPDLTEEELSSFRNELSMLPNADEATTRQGFAKTKLFPALSEYKHIAVGGDLPFDQTALPFTRGFNLPPIVTPKPDAQYGYPCEVFSTIECAVMRHNRLATCSHPSTATYWPFFVVEYKSASRGGTRWVGENQNAGTGSHCVNSMETLLEYTRQPGVQHKLWNSVAWSCVADADFGSLWVHWQDSETDDGTPRFVSSEVESFSFKKPKDLREFRKSVRNIIEHGIDSRLPLIKKALADCLPLIAGWNEEDKKAKIRKRASQINKDVITNSGSQGSRMKLGE